MKYLRFSLLVGVPEEEISEPIDEIVSNDLRDVINGDLAGIDVPYGMVCSEIEYQGDETK